MFTAAQEQNLTNYMLDYCEPPPLISDANYTVLNEYPVGLDIEYNCIQQPFMQTTNNILTCAIVNNGTPQWVGASIKCRLQLNKSKLKYL